MTRKRQSRNISGKSLLSDNSPFAFSESYKSLRTNLEFSTFDGELKVILLTSSIPDEGKSSVSINIAKTLADTGKKVLLIDGDLRSPTVGRYLRVRRDVTQGFSTVLSGKASLKESIYTYNASRFDVMLSGPIPPNPAELLSRNLTEHVLNELKELYDYILIDTPPVGVVSDATVLSRYVDGALFVVRHNSTNKEVARDALKRLKASKVNVLGVVVNDYDSSKDLNAAVGYEYQYHYDPQSLKGD